MATILCIDDHTRHFESRTQRLHASGHNVIRATDVCAATDLLACNPVDAVVLDCHTEGLDNFVRTLRTCKPGVPVLMLSAYCVGWCSMSFNADACMQKHDPEEDLLRVLEAVLSLAKYGLCRGVPISGVA